MGLPAHLAGSVMPQPGACHKESVPTGCLRRLSSADWELGEVELSMLEEGREELSLSMGAASVLALTRARMRAEKCIDFFVM